MRVYLDNCSFNRPFDDQSKVKIKLESEAKLYIQRLILDGKLDLVWSYILDFENSKNPFVERKILIAKWRDVAIVDVEENNFVLEMAQKLFKIGLKKMDALHLACAIYAQCRFFITTDNGILRKKSKIKEINVIDPIGFVMEVL